MGQLLFKKGADTLPILIFKILDRFLADSAYSIVHATPELLGIQNLFLATLDAF